MFDRHADLIAARRWFWLAVSVLLIAGAFALLLVIARMPPFDAMVTDPAWFRRGLVVHVQMSIVCWFYAFVAALLMTLPPGERLAGLSPWGPRLGLLGVFLTCASAFAPGARPIMSNYVPVVDHGLGLCGLALFGLGVLVTALSRRLLPAAREHESQAGGLAAIPRPALRAAALALLLAALTLVGTVPFLPEGAAPEVHYEVLFWGMGHVLQVASVAAMLGVWLWIVRTVTGKAVLVPRTQGLVFVLLLLPWLIAPLLPAAGTWSATYRQGFTRLMQFGIAPTVLFIAVACVLALRRHRRAGGALSPLTAGFAASLLLTLLGFVLGACIRDANTMVPAHYHANIGAVTAAFMTISFPLLSMLGLPQPEGRWAWWSHRQPVWFALGQSVFAAGFALAGSMGMGRKIYGQEQAARSVGETVGLVVMGIGGFVAIAAGVLFLIVHVRSFIHTRVRADVRAAVTGGSHA
ncbi:MAG: hypothetical protein IPK26_16200 [Planctomycetes bacterium]|nr:hypothetical protein [Planctomycetota bacterium]